MHLRVLENHQDSHAVRYRIHGQLTSAPILELVNEAESVHLSSAKRICISLLSSKAFNGRVKEMKILTQHKMAALSFSFKLPIINVQIYFNYNSTYILYC